jgi:hypothetical protein
MTINNPEDEMAYKGRYRPENPSKYAGDPTKVIYRSLWERRFMVYCDRNQNVKRWGSEEIVVPYRSPVDGRNHRYFVDFIVESINPDGSTQTSLIEIKPKSQTKEPVKKNQTKKRMLSEVTRWGVNKAKWEAATEFAKRRGWTFKILTEDHILKGKKHG